MTSSEVKEPGQNLLPTAAKPPFLFSHSFVFIVDDLVIICFILCHEIAILPRFHIRPHFYEISRFYVLGGVVVLHERILIHISVKLLFQVVDNCILERNREIFGELCVNLGGQVSYPPTVRLRKESVALQKGSQYKQSSKSS